VTHQPLDALVVANEARVAQAAVRHALAGRTLTLGEALEHPAVQTMTVYRLLTAQRGWGPRRASECLRGVGVSESRRVSQLTARQRKLLSVTLRGQK